MEYFASIIAGIWSSIGSNDKQLLVVFTGALFAVTAGLVCYTKRLWIATRDLVRDTARSAQLQTRAFIFLERIDIVVGDGHLPQVEPKLRNGGTTPIKNGLTHTTFYYSETPLPDSFDFPDLPPFGIEPVVLGPQASAISELFEIPSKINSNLERRHGHFYVWGWIDYDDIFPNSPRHRTEFCNEIIYTSVTNNSVRWGAKSHHRFNGTDDECMKQPKPYVKPT